MKLNRIILTGADDSIKPADLLAISKEFPMVEWGILFNSGQAGQLLHPSREWVKTFARVAIENNLQCSMHISGRWAKQIVEEGAEPFFMIHQDILDAFVSIQLNFDPENVEIHENFWNIVKKYKKFFHLPMKPDYVSQAVKHFVNDYKNQYLVSFVLDIKTHPVPLYLDNFSISFNGNITLEDIQTKETRKDVTIEIAALRSENDIFFDNAETVLCLRSLIQYI